MTTDSNAERRLLKAVAEYKAAPARALEARDKAIREAAESGLKQVDIVRITGYTRETVRRALNPEIRAAVKQAAEQRKSAKEQSNPVVGKDAKPKDTQDTP